LITSSWVNKKKKEVANTSIAGGDKDNLIVGAEGGPGLKMREGVKVHQDIHCQKAFSKGRRRDLTGKYLEEESTYRAVNKEGTGNQRSRKRRFCGRWARWNKKKVGVSLEKQGRSVGF